MKNSSGTALVLVLGMIAVMSIMLTHAWFMSGMAYDIALQRERWNKKFYATDVVVAAVLKPIARDYDKIKKMVSSNKQVVQYDMSNLLRMGDRQDVHAGAVVQKPVDGKSNGLMVTAWYRDTVLGTCSIRCLIEKKVIQHHGNDVACLVVSHTTVGAGL